MAIKNAVIRDNVAEKIDGRVPFTVIHPSANAILAYCDTRKEAEQIVMSLNILTRGLASSIIN